MRQAIGFKKDRAEEKLATGEAVKVQSVAEMNGKIKFKIKNKKIKNENEK